MLKLLETRWVQYIIGGLGVFAVGFAVGFINSRVVIPPERPDRVVLNGGSTNLSQPIPLWDAEAIEAGWKNPFRCIATRAARLTLTPGRYFAPEPDGERLPYMLIYTAGGPLLGIYLFSETEMPPPWEHLEPGLIDVVNMGFEHWGLYLHFRARFETCGKIHATKTG